MIEGTRRLALSEGGEVGIAAAVYAQQRFSAEGVALPIEGETLALLANIQ